ncbi:MAG: lysophospholipid acyltransferase family protein [Flavitalea sp.]
MRTLLFPIRIIYCVYALVLFIAIMFCIIPFVVAASFFGKIKGGNVIYRLCAFWTDAWCLLIGIRHTNLYDAPHDKSKQYIFVANHISYMDAPIIVKTIRQPVRALGKAEMSRIPFFGFIYRRAIVTVQRNNPENRAKSVRILRSILKKKISIFMFPEGTFNETHQPLKEFFDGAFRIAIETQTPIKPLLFLDGYNRMHYRSVFSLRPGRSRSVFLEEVSVAGLTMKDVQELKQKVYQRIEHKLIDYKADWIID